MANLKKKLQRERQRRKKLQPTTVMDRWVDKDGLHCIGEGTPPSDEDYAQMTQDYQKRIKNSPMWDEWVKQFGKKKAEEMLKECVAKPG